MHPLAHAHTLAHALGPEWTGILGAFEAGDPGPIDPAALPEAIARVLSDEVDADQAALFARRYRQVEALLASLAAPEARVLEALLPYRAAGLLLAPPPRAQRVRALVDFVFSHAAAAATKDPAAPSPADRVRGAALRPIAPGVAHATVEGPTSEGPLHVNLLRLDGVRLDAIPTCPAGDLVAACREVGAVAGFSGGFFLYSEPDVAPPAARGDPVGLLVSQGRVLGAPTLRRGALVQRADGRVSIEVIGPEQATWRVRGRALPVVAAFNRAQGDHGPAALSVAISHGQVLAVGSALPVPLAGVVLQLAEPVPLDVGDLVDVALPGVVTAMAGGPRLLGRGSRDLVVEDFAGTAPPLTFSQDETYDTNRLPRMAVGLTPTGTLWVVAVDGRNLQRAPGLTLAQTGDLLATLGCDRALNLDGGSSKRMVIDGRVVDLPSTEVVTGSSEERVRPVRSALRVFA